MSGLTSYRLWIYTSSDDSGGSKAQLTLTLEGTLGTVTFEHLERTVPRQGELFQSGHCCELYQEAEEIGSMLKLTVVYQATGGNKPWNLTQIIMRESKSGVVSVFPAGRTLSGRELLVLTPRLTWYEDRYGNCYEEAPTVPPAGGQWQWPAMPLPSANEAGASGLEASRLSHHAQLQYRLWEAVAKEEIAPLVDAALQDLAQQRTPGTLLHECMQAAAGRPASSIGSKGSYEELKRRNIELSSLVTTLEQEHEAKGRHAMQADAATKQLQTEKENLEKQLRDKKEQLRQTQMLRDNTQKSSACVIA